MINCGIFEVKQAEDGSYEVTDQLTGDTILLRDAAGVGAYVREKVQEVEEMGEQG